MAYMSSVVAVFLVGIGLLVGFVCGTAYRTHTARLLPRVLRTTQAQRTARVVSPSERRTNSLKAFEDNVI